MALLLLLGLGDRPVIWGVSGNKTFVIISIRPFIKASFTNLLLSGFDETRQKSLPNLVAETNHEITAKSPLVCFFCGNLSFDLNFGDVLDRRKDILHTMSVLRNKTS